MAKIPTKYDEEFTNTTHPSQDNTRRFSIDQLLRKHGFRIQERRGDDEPLWEKQGKVYTQRRALRTIDKDEVRKARVASENHIESVCPE